MPWECLGNLSSQPCPQAPGSHLGKLRHRRGDLACSEMLIPSVTGSSNPGTGTGQTGGTEQTGDKQPVSPHPSVALLAAWLGGAEPSTRPQPVPGLPQRLPATGRSGPAI